MPSIKTESTKTESTKTESIRRKNMNRNLKRAYPAMLFATFLVAGFSIHRLQAIAGGISMRQQATQQKVQKIASAFEPFTPKVKTHADERFFYVESNGMPDHPMMVGITSWQQQVPMPQSYTGQNAWQFPLNPVPAANPLSGKTHFFRGAMAIATDGVPIFNALNNRGEDSNAIGELDEYGGHCGRADDYHYHIAPTYITKKVGADKPVGYALDGYALYGYTEPDGSPAGKLDAFNGHTTQTLGYHYHATKTYPYLNGGFHGEVVEREGQVDPQPRANSVRPATTPLRGAKITGYEIQKAGSYSLTYTLNGGTYKINYALQAGGAYKFDYVDAQGRVTTETYTGRAGGGGQGGGGRNRPPRPGDGNGPPPNGGGDPNRPPRPDDGNGPPQDNGQGERPRRNGPRNGDQGGGGNGGGRRGGEGPGTRDAADTRPDPELDATLAKLPKFSLKSSVVGADHLLPTEFTGDGDSISPPLEWSGAPAGTKSYVLVMHHLDPQGLVKWYWTLYNIPADTRSLPKNVKGIGTSGTNSINRTLGYAPPHSQGPGLKTYTITVYALATEPKLDLEPRTVNRRTLLNAIKDRVLGTAELKVNYTRPAQGSNPPRNL